MRGKRFATAEEGIQISQEGLKNISISKLKNVLINGRIVGRGVLQQRILWRWSTFDVSIKNKKKHIYVTHTPNTKK